MVRTCTCTHARKHANTAKPPSVSPAHVHILIHTRDASAPQQLSGPSCPSREKNRKHPHGIDLTFGCETRVRAWARTLSKMTSFGKYSCITASLRMNMNGPAPSFGSGAVGFASPSPFVFSTPAIGRRICVTFSSPAPSVSL